MEEFSDFSAWINSWYCCHCGDASSTHDLVVDCSVCQHQRCNQCQVGVDVVERIENTPSASRYELGQWSSITPLTPTPTQLNQTMAEPQVKEIAPTPSISNPLKTNAASISKPPKRKTPSVSTPPKRKTWAEKEHLMEQKVAARQKSREAQAHKSATDSASLSAMKVGMYCYICHHQWWREDENVGCPACGNVWTEEASSLREWDYYHSRGNRTHITTPTEGPDNPPRTFVQQFHTPRAGPPRPGQILWCEFFGLLECHETFRLDEEAEWIQHHVEHMGNRFPRTLMCWFCDHVPFVAEDPRDALANFVERMEHVRGHIVDDHRTTANTRRDLHVVTHLHDHGRLTRSEFEVAMQYDETPDSYRLTGNHSYPPSSSSYYHSPSLGIDLSSIFPQPPPTPTSTGFLWATQIPNLAPLESGMTTAWVTPSLTTRHTAEEPDTVSGPTTLWPFLLTRKTSHATVHDPTGQAAPPGASGMPSVTATLWEDEGALLPPPPKQPSNDAVPPSPQLIQASPDPVRQPPVQQKAWTSNGPDIQHKDIAEVHVVVSNNNSDGSSPNGYWPPIWAPKEGLPQTSDPMSSKAKFDTPATDSGYASAFNPLLLSAKSGRADDKPSPPALPWENGRVGGDDDDARTIYSAATTIAQADARHYVSELSSEIAQRLGQQHADLKHVTADRAALSELTKAFGIEIGRESPSQTNRDIMYFVHKYHRQITLQLESLFSYENGEVPTNHDDSDRMSLMEKMRLWNNKADSDEGLSLSSDDLFEGIEDDEDEDISHTGFSAHSSVIRKSTALHWLVSGLQKRSLLDWGGEQVPGTVVANGIRRKILEALPSGKISRKRLPQEHEVLFRLLHEDYISDPPPQNPATRPDAIIITECVGRTQATTIEQYLNQAWPRSGMRIFQLLQEATRNARLGAKSGSRPTCVSAVLAGNNRLSMAVDHHGIVVTATGSAHALADYGEQLGWLSAALRPKIQDSCLPCTPSLAIRQHAEPNRRTYIDIHTYYSPLPYVPPFRNGSMGQPEGVIVVCGFPTRRQPEGYCGFETRLRFLLGAGYRKVNMDGRPSLERDEKDTLTLIRRADERVFLWSDRRCVSRGCWAADAANWHRNEREELESARHIILRCRSSCTIEGLSPTPCLGDEVETSGSKGNVGPCDQADSEEPGILDEESKGNHDVDVELPDNAPLQAEFQEDLPCSTDSDIDSDMLSVSDPSDSASTLDCLSPVMSLLRAGTVRRLVSGYQAVMNGAAPGSEVTASTGPPVSTSSRTLFIRRKRGWGQSGNNHNEEDDDDPSSPRNEKRLKLPSSSKESQRVLTCPLWKADPSKHRRCFAFDLRRIRDVKQHLKRVHRPEHYCRRCSTIFKNRESLAQHVYNPAGLSCPISTQLDGISDDQQEQISKKSKRNLSEEQQWFVIWEILFPGRPRPTSAYREAGISEELYSFREYCRAYGDTLLNKEVEALTPTAADALPGFQGLSIEERCSILRWAFREAVELAFDDWISDRPLDGQRRGDEAGPASTATPAGCSLADSGVASMTTQLSVSRHSLDALPSEGNTSVEGALMGGQGGFARESQGSAPELEPWPELEDVSGFEPLLVENYDGDFSNILNFPDQSDLEF